MKTVFLNRFGGIADDPRARTAEGRLVKHFDVFSFSHKLIPYGGVVTDATDQIDVGNLLVGTDGLIYGLGTNGSVSNKMYTKASLTANWSTDADLSGGGSAIGYDLFVEYHTSSGWVSGRRILFGDYTSATAGSAIRLVDPTGAAGSSSHSLSWSSLAQGVVHPEDDILYIPYDNKIAVNDNGSWTDVGLTLPASRKITSICPYGAYLAIATVPTTPGVINQNSIVYLWDRDTSLSTVSDIIDWGNGTLNVLNTLDNVLVGVSLSGGASGYVRNSNSIQIKAYNGVSPVLVKEITGVLATLSNMVNFVNNNRLYFAARVSETHVQSATTTHTGVWAFGRNKEGRFTVSIERMATSNNSDYNNHPLAAVVVKDYAIIVHTDYGTITRTSDDDEVFTHTSNYDTLINSGMPDADRPQMKKLYAVAATFEPLPADGVLELWYRVDSGSWVQIAEADTANATSVEMSSALDGTEFTDGREYEFRVISSGGAQPTGIIYRYETLDTLI